MNLRRLLPFLAFIVFFSVSGHGQDQNKKAAEKVVPPRTLNENQQKRRADMIKSVPITEKTIETMRLQNKKASMEQMHKINKAVRQSMIIHKRR
jgi:hypothetical protein